jgi:hypothetical protein
MWISFVAVRSPAPVGAEAGRRREVCLPAAAIRVQEFVLGLANAAMSDTALPFAQGLVSVDIEQGPPPTHRQCSGRSLVYT